MSKKGAFIYQQIEESGSGTALPGNVYLTGANYYNESVRTIKQGYLSNE